MIHHLFLPVNPIASSSFLKKKNKLNSVAKFFYILLFSLFLFVFSVVFIEAKFEYEKELLYYIVFFFSCLAILVSKIKNIKIRNLENEFLKEQLYKNQYEVKVINKEVFFKNSKQSKEYQVCSFVTTDQLTIYYFNR